MLQLQEGAAAWKALKGMRWMAVSEPGSPGPTSDVLGEVAGSASCRSRRASSCPGKALLSVARCFVSETWCQSLCQRNRQLQNVYVRFCRRGRQTKWKYLMRTPWEVSQQDVASEENTNSSPAALKPGFVLAGMAQSAGTCRAVLSNPPGQNIADSGWCLAESAGKNRSGSEQLPEETFVCWARPLPCTPVINNALLFRFQPWLRQPLHLV